ncbi:MAG: HAMP domain-containing histidine kinase [Oscillospiraceae bacterium]|nr:HAMP domain-containing histidine kinase [Oscillospiraceae bacterium]
MPRTLDAKMMYMLLLSLLVAGAVFLTAYGLGTLLLDRIYMSPESVAARQAEIYSDFSRYVKANRVSGSDENAVANWPGNDEYTTILIYRDEDLPTTGLSPAIGGAAYSNANRLQYASEYGRLYSMRFADGIYHIAIGDSSRVREDTLNRILAVILAAVSFLAVMLWYVRRLTRRVIRLSREADVIGDGDLEAPITLQGVDELSQLAREVDSMRHSVIARMSGERKAWEANSELITAISHDIRTPMTALIGYLDLLNEDGFQNPERAKRFASSAYQKAMELKDLTDELFRYFLVFGRARVEMNKEELDGRLLLEQLLGEAQFDLSDAGFGIQRQDFEGECSIFADPLYLKRVLDNLVSNLKKYADKSQPVVFLTQLQEGVLSVCLSNTVRKDLNLVESTKIGLRTCEKIMQAMEGSFAVQKDDTHFAATFSLPVLK